MVETASPDVQLLELKTEFNVLLFTLHSLIIAGNAESQKRRCSGCGHGNEIIPYDRDTS